MSNFTPVSSLLGGLLIGLAAALLWLANGRIAGISGRLDASAPILIAGGLLVGFGTRLGGGCTSGHGVCGMARFSRRSIVATCLFMAAGFVTVFVMRHIVGS